MNECCLCDQDGQTATKHANGRQNAVKKDSETDRKKRWVGGGVEGGQRASPAAAGQPGHTALNGGIRLPQQEALPISAVRTRLRASQLPKILDREHRQTDLFGSFGGCERRWTTVSLTTEGWRHPQMQFSDEWRATRAAVESSCRGRGSVVGGLTLAVRWLISLTLPSAVIKPCDTLLSFPCRPTTRPFALCCVTPFSRGLLLTGSRRESSSPGAGVEERSCQILSTCLERV
ncbi:hypothetical protein JOL62DRAFT_369535 [Phyllosticta paracitricarpa]|uniref:Uncharacterized protein n=1 Tax=Phyllosticta paracitricarpa TaxID=2016321 RepID=A0ABR1MT21_9PEZI